MTLMTVPDRPLGRGRPFAIHTSFPKNSELGWIVHDVLDLMLPTEIPVPLPGDPLWVSRYLNQWIGRGRLVARDWLPAVCNAIRLNNLRGADDAQYRTNLDIALLRHVDLRQVWTPQVCRRSRLPMGVGSLWCEIAMDLAIFTGERGALSFVLAHEIVHAINALGIVAPALADWRAFQASFRSGLNREVGAMIESRMLDSFLDDYGGDELTLVGRFWPSAKVEEWYEQYRQWSSAIGPQQRDQTPAQTPSAGARCSQPSTATVGPIGTAHGTAS